MERRYLLLSVGLAAALSLAHAGPLLAAEDKVAVDEGGRLSERLGSSVGMPSSNPRVRSILAAHPNQYVVICVAGCGKPKIVQILPAPAAQRIGQHVPSAGKTNGEVYGPPSPGRAGRRGASKQDDVVCLAGCIGKPGKVLQHISGLPPPRRSDKRETR